MASNPTAAQKSSSRWGSFLSSVESRLDTILADEDPKAQQKNDGRSSEHTGKQETMAIPPERAPSPARTASASKAQDRLNEKLARAMANKNLARKGDGSAFTSGVPSRTASPANVADSPRVSADIPREERPLSEEHLANGIEKSEDTKDSEQASPIRITISEQDRPRVEPAPQDEATEPRLSTEAPEPSSTRLSLETPRSSTPKIAESPQSNRVSTPLPAQRKLPEEYEKAIEQLQADNETAELRRQEETHAYLERIDALQSKLQYLAKEAAEIAKTTSSEAKPGSLEQKLAAKDEKIALLIDEGQKLSQTELKHMTAIKKLRAKSSDDEKAVAEAKRVSEKQEKNARDALDRAKRAEAAEKRAAEKLKDLSKLERDFENVRADRDAKEPLIRDLQIQLSEVTSAAKQAEEKAQTEALHAERQRAAELADELSTVRSEKELVEREHKSALHELREKAEREKERARVAEIERQGEQSILESRLESYRARAEEASAGQGGDVQAKLLRQVETLQNQYAIASENWQGIEGSLLSRVTALEKEKDEIAKREGDIRRKARETVSCLLIILGFKLTIFRASSLSGWRKSSKELLLKRRTLPQKSRPSQPNSHPSKTASTKLKPRSTPLAVILRRSENRGNHGKLSGLKRSEPGSKKTSYAHPRQISIHSFAAILQSSISARGNLPMQRTALARTVVEYLASKALASTVPTSLLQKNP